MAKRRRRRRAQQTEGSSVNWTLIGGIAVAGVIGLLALVYASLNAPETVAAPTPVLDETVVALENYCDDFPERCVVTGAEDAPVTVVEISDYGCPHCYNFNTQTAPALQQQYIDSGQVQWIVMPFALGSLTKPSAEAVLCAAEQGEDVGYEFHETVFQLQSTTAAHTDDGFESVAQQVEGLNVDELMTCVEEDRYSGEVSLNIQAAQQVNVASTPTFFLNGRRLEGNQPLNVFQQQLDILIDSNS